MTASAANDGENRLAVCHTLGSLGSGGRATLLLQLVRNTDRVDHTLCVFVGDEDLEAEFEAAGATVFEMDATGMTDLGAVARFARFLLDREFDIVHAHGPVGQIPSRVFGSLSGQTAVSTHQVVREVHDRRLLTLERLTRPLDAAEVAVSEAVERSYLGEDSRPNWQVIYNAIDGESFNEAVRTADTGGTAADHNLEDAGPIYLNIGRFIDIKAQDDALRALADLLDDQPDAHLVVIGGRGDEEIRRGLDTLASDLGIEDHATILGRVPRRRIHEYYALADVFVSASLLEGFPLVVLEAMAAELPVVAADAPGVDEAVVDGETGYLCPTRAPAELADRMRELGDAELRESMGRAGARRVCREFSIERTVEAYVNLYETVVGR